jgi:uncharacterized protein YkwD
VSRRRALAVGPALALALGTAKGLAGEVAVAAAAGLDVAAAETQLLELLNADRVAAGLPPVQADARLMEVARWRSEDMVTRNYFGHDIGGYTVFKVLQERQIAYRVAGENVAMNTFDEQQTVQMAQRTLMDSPPHRTNILRREFNLAGIGVATGSDRKVVYTQIFVQA